MEISRTLIQIDRFCDYIPVVSTITNLVDLCFKAIFSIANSFSYDGHSLCENRYVSYLHDDKSAARSLLLLIPIIGNIAAHSGLIVAKLKSSAEGKETLTNILNAVEPYTTKPQVFSSGPLSFDEYSDLLNIQNQLLQFAVNEQCSAELLGELNETEILARRLDRYHTEVDVQNNPKILELQQKNLELRGQKLQITAEYRLSSAQKTWAILKDAMATPNYELVHWNWEFVRMFGSRKPVGINLSANLRVSDYIFVTNAYCEMEGINEIIGQFQAEGGSVSQETIYNLHAIAELSEQMNEVRRNYYTGYLNKLNDQELLAEAQTLCRKEQDFSRVVLANLQEALTTVQKILDIVRDDKRTQCKNVDILALRNVLQNR